MQNVAFSGAGSAPASRPVDPEGLGGVAAARLSSRIPALDGFRAIAITIVILSHVGLEHVVPGQFGVTLFFFLSGYLITTLLRQELGRTGRVDLRGFYARRVLRIVPPMYLTIVFAALLSAAGLTYRMDMGALVWDFLFLSNYVPRSGIPIGLWSLAVEEHFYLLFPLVLVLVTARTSLKRFAAWCAVACGIALLVRLGEARWGNDLLRINFWTHTRIDSILYGAVLALWNNPVMDREDRLPGRSTSYLIGGALLLSTFVIRDDVFRQTLRYAIQGLALLLLFNAAIRERGWLRWLLDNRVTRFVALHSYTLYLVHVALVLGLAPLAAVLGDAGAKLVAIAASFGYAMAMHAAVERPIARWWKNRIKVAV